MKHPRLFAFCLLLMLTIFGYIQSSAQELQPKTKAQTEQSITKTATLTGQKYNSLPVYKSSKGSLFVIMKSKKTGNVYKLYLSNKI